jgi:hypothetical protein
LFGEAEVLLLCSWDGPWQDRQIRKVPWICKRGLNEQQGIGGPFLRRPSYDASLVPAQCGSVCFLKTLQATQFRMFLIKFFTCGNTSASRYPFANAIPAGKTNEQQRHEWE